MKILLIFAMLVSFTACANARPQQAQASSPPLNEFKSVRVFIDPDTGCEYLVAENTGISMTPRISNSRRGDYTNYIKGCKN